MSGSSSTGAVRPPFTAAQWQELELQALIYKYVVAGLPVPPNLLAPIRNSFELMSARFFHHPSLGYGSFYGKKMDPEPGRCRRTDGKKWRCSKDAHPHSKYCERHMHRSRNRSRKPVESQNTSQSVSTVTSNFATGSSSGSGSFQSQPFHSISFPEDPCFGSNAAQSRMEPVSFGISNKEDSGPTMVLLHNGPYRYLHALKPEEDQQHFLPETSESVRGLRIESTLDDTWRLTPSQVPSNSLSKPLNGTLLQRNYHQLHTLQDFEPVTVGAVMSKQQQQQQHCFIGGEFGSLGPGKKEHQSHRPLFDEWLKARDSCSDLDDERSYRNSFSTTQLSISMAPSESIAKSACSQTDA